MKIFLQLICVLQTAVGISQDAFSVQFNNSKVLYNPACTALKGSTSIGIRIKSQWQASKTDPYSSAFLIYEESLPCNILDYGVKFSFDQEGAGLLKTYEAGALLVASPSISASNSNHNFRFGVDLSWGMHLVQYDKLIFSDQLDPQFGVVRSTGFVAPNDGRSSLYFNPGLGFLYRGLYNTKSMKAQLLNLGFSVYNMFSMNSNVFSNSKSILGIHGYNALKFIAFFDYEVIPYQYKNSYISIKPLLLYQRQANIQSTDIEARIGILQTLAFSAYFHFTDFGFQKHTSWVNLNAELGFKINENRRIDLNLNYCNNISGLQNFAGVQIELGISYHLRKLTKSCGSPIKVNCNSFTSPRNKIYENIW